MTEDLWKKEKSCDELLYIDLFKTINHKHFTKMDDQLLAFKSEHNGAFAKNNEKSSALLLEGNRFFEESDFYRAADLYTESLCFAEIGTENASKAFANRAECFHQLKLYDHALIDIEMALEVGCSENAKLKLEQLRDDCQRMKLSNKMDQLMATRKLDFEPDRKFPCLANVLSITTNERFGRHIIAKCDIDVGQNVLMEESFASVNHSSVQMCYTCSSEMKNFVSCSECSDVAFCNDKSMRSNLVHRIDCQTLYHRMPYKVQFIIRSILMAVAAFPDIDHLMTFVEDCVTTDSLPESLDDWKSNYCLYLKLKKTLLNKNVLIDAYDLFRSIMLIPSIEVLFDTKRKQRFLMHLLLHHLAINVNNGYESETTTSIGAVLCLFNHSCAPNLFNFAVDNRKYCVTIRPVKKGEQLFISYLGRCDDQSAKRRQHELKSRWNFECKCDKCEPQTRLADCNKLRQDSCYKFIYRNYKGDASDFMNTTLLKKKCIKFLQKYGHLSFSSELEFISGVYTTLI